MTANASFEVESQQTEASGNSEERKRVFLKGCFRYAVSLNITMAHWHCVQRNKHMFEDHNLNIKQPVRQTLFRSPAK
eukprot:5544170-Heterocapsa_arctica.AAC.1